MQELLPKSRQNRESPFSYSRCRFIGWLKKLAALPWGTDRHSQCAHWLGNDATRNRMTRRCVLLSTFPAVGKSGPPETRSLCRRAYWKKVTVGDKRRTNCPTSALRTSLLPPYIKFLQFLHISPDLSNSLDRKRQYPDVKSNNFDKMELIAFTVPQNPRKTAVSQTGTSLAITMGRRSTDRRIYVSLFE